MDSKKHWDRDLEIPGKHDQSQRLIPLIFYLLLQGFIPQNLPPQE